MLCKNFLKSLIFIFVFTFNFKLNGQQNPSWSQPPRLISFAGGINVSSVLGTTTSDYAHNVATDINGNILFYIVDGIIYNASGAIIDQIEKVISSVLSPVTGTTQYLVVPVPGNCNQYYLIAGSYTGLLSVGGNPQPYYIKIDVTVPNTQTGHNGELYNNAGIPVNVADKLDTYFNFDQHSGALHMAVTPLRCTTNDRLLFVASSLHLFRYRITAAGIVYDNYTVSYGIIWLPCGHKYRLIVYNI